MTTVAGLPPELVVTAVAVYLLAGAIKGTIGIGLPTAAVSLMAQASDVRAAIALVVVPMIVLNAWQVHRSGDALGTWRRFRVLALVMTVGIGAVALFADRVPTPVVTLVLGVVITLFAAVSLARELPRIPARLDRGAQALAGVAAGAMGGIAGVWAPPIIVYLNGIGLDKDGFVRATGLLLTLGSAILAASYAANGLLDAPHALAGLALVAPALAGFALGERLRSRLSGEGFRRAVLLFFLLMGLNLVRRALVGTG